MWRNGRRVSEVYSSLYVDLGDANDGLVESFIRMRQINDNVCGAGRWYSMPTFLKDKNNANVLLHGQDPRR